MTEKKWIVFQLLYGLFQLHSKGFTHGDIKPNNVLLSSYNWVFLTDIVPYKPTFIGEENLKKYNLFFGEMENNLRCYVAPERFVPSAEEEQKVIHLLLTIQEHQSVTPAMDLFSLGCVIAGRSPVILNCL